MDQVGSVAWQVDFWDVGQGDATSIRLLDGRYVLIDTGPGVKTGNPLVQWFSRGTARRIHAAIITHNDLDHFGGLQSLAIRPEQVIDSVYLLRDATAATLPKKFEALLEPLRIRAKAGRTETRYLNTERSLYEDGLFRLAVRYPSALETMGVQANNAISAIITLERASDGAVMVAWGADALLKTVAERCRNTCPAILVGPHHGAPQDQPSNSRAFRAHLGEIGPGCVFISVGKGNTYGHPSRPYILAAASDERTVCCSEVNEKCRRSCHINQAVFQGSGRLGLPVPPRTLQCRGTMRVTVDATGVRFDEHQTEFRARTKLLDRALCNLGNH